MQSFNNKTRFYSFRADANALGGFLEEPLNKHHSYAGAGLFAGGRRVCNGAFGSV